MQSSPDSSLHDGSRPRWQIPRVDGSRVWIGGVSVAIATEVGVPVIWVRFAFFALALVGGWGIAAYLSLWAVLTWAQMSGVDAEPPSIGKGRNPTLRAIGFGSVVIGLLFLFAALPGLRTGLVIGLLIAGAGFGLVRAALSPERSTNRGTVDTVAMLVGGFGLVGLGTMVFAAGFGAGATAVIALVVGLTFAVLAASSPWWWGLVRRFDSERQARVRADERAAVGAQLHDSVLQTLALIQNQSDPAVIAQLARRQERELRNWLEPDRLSRSGSSLKGQLDIVTADIESLYAVRVETVVVADVLLTPDVDALVAATREAIVNAAKHSGAPTVDVFAEVGQDRVEVFVRDRGSGFDQDGCVHGIGIRDSMRGRLDRVGGKVVIVSAVGEGTEVELSIPRSR